MGLIEIVLSFLKVDMSNSFVQETLRAGPVESIFYLIFFPTVIIIIFVFLLVGWIMGRVGGKSFMDGW